MSTPRSMDPERIAAIWGHSRRGTRGPRSSLTLEQVARAAIDLADAEGLESVSMKRLAERLQVGTMTLYTYVPDKATLLLVMLDRAVSEVDLPEGVVDWQQHLRHCATALLDVYRRHTWMMQITVDGPPLAPSQMRYLESVLRALQPTGISPEESIDIAMSVSYYVLGAAKLTSGILQAEEAAGLSAEQSHAERVEAFSSVLDPAEFPMVLQVMTSPAAEPRDMVDSLGFEFGLDRLIDGICAHIGARQPRSCGSA